MHGQNECRKVDVNMTDLHFFIETILKTNKPTVIAMIVDIEGSSYRKEGAWMLFMEDAAPIGLLSGGCLENDLQIRANALYATGRTERIAYDLSAEDDLGWGRGVGCNGVVHILLRDVDNQFKKSLQVVQQNLMNREPVLFIQSMTQFDQYVFSSEQQDPFQFWAPENEAQWQMTKPFQKIAGQRNFGDQSYFIQLIWPTPNLYVFGAGFDARPLVKFASEAGFSVHVFDWRENFSHTDDFPTAKTIQQKLKSNLLEDITMTPLDAFVIMTHDFEIDQQLVQQLGEKKLLYIGVLGSQKRTERLLHSTPKTPIRTPVGLAIGADGPTEIAISITAELIAVKRGEIS